ncbi:3-deoxy-D-manno-octulosonic acid kinase [Methylohalomonas lacus]|uniref:3-deoxy-D-manno-octulosonic acid kinase n=1 Tax=Methylohalomonas lacus TaxID=398773 RepID=A0AAE3HHY5_9GAMM|nr:3-deoxy-D-manno-octulosonic acid kinase [Methylohalomonas lacus]MCS3902676.1 3-deoxy-D-manno-octulosonic acid kinase [Methylohalomonas lacus]
MNPTELEIDRDCILYDADLLDIADAPIFDPDALQTAALLTGQATGRGNSFFFQFSGLNLVLRHYRRGGLVAKLLGDRYLYSGLAASRAWREFTLLARLQQLGLAVPQPVAVRVRRHGVFYRADIVTRQIESSRTLTQCLTQTALAANDWAGIGRTLRQFHDCGVYHADLNAHNILLNAAGRVYLIDFDRGRLRDPRKSGWQQRNLQRLRRSLDKLVAARPGFQFDSNDWSRLLAGYRA